MLDENSVKKTVLKNGIRVYAIDIKYSPFVTVCVGFNVGSRDETSEEHGIAHFLEHSMFSGTKKRLNNKVIGFEVENIGGEMNAATSEEMTVYYIKVPYENFLKALEILSDMLLNSTFNEQFIEVEKGVVKEELKMYEDNPMQSVSDVFNELMYKGTPLGKSIIGTLNSISSFSREKILGFIKRNYLNKSTVISIVGNLNGENIIPEVEKYFNPNIGSNIRKQDYIKANFNNVNNVNLKIKDVNQSHIVLGIRGLPISHKDLDILKLISVIIGGGFGSKIFQKLRNDLGVAYYAASSISAYRDTGDLYVRAGVDNSKFKMTIIEVMDLLNQFHKGDFSSDDIHRAKEFVKGSLASEEETTQECAFKSIASEFAFGRLKSVKEEKKSIDEIKKDDMVRVFDSIYTKVYLAAISPYDNINEISNIIADVK